VNIRHSILTQQGGQTFSTEGHIENFIATGGPHILHLSTSVALHIYNLALLYFTLTLWFT